MRFAKGSFIVSRDRDIPLLRQVRNSKFVTQNQLFQFMKLQNIEHSRNAFNWRVARLREGGNLNVCPEVQGADSTVYQITRTGLSLLEHFREFATALNSDTVHLPNGSQAMHALELNEIQLALSSKNLLANWQSEVEIASFNLTSSNPFQKDYDAVVDVRLGAGREARFALEYERSLKAASHYDRIARALEAEQALTYVLYLGANTELLVSLMRRFEGVSKELLFACVDSFEHDLLDTDVFTGLEAPVTKFRALLQ
jgi:hypothetical protein